MELGPVDIAAFVIFLLVVMGVSLYASRKEETSEDYFLAGRGLTWWLIGFSLIASNISTEQFVGMAGAGFGDAGMAIASYEWLSAVAMVFIALVLLPVFLRSGLFTIPEFLEYRYSPAARAVMAAYSLIVYVAVTLASVLYSGAVAIETIFGLELWLGVWLIGILAAGYTIYGGLKAVVWSDLIQGATLIAGGAIVMVLGFRAVGGVDAFFEANSEKLHMILPADHQDLPWTSLLAGIWIPVTYYWGLNQFITQRTLGAKSLAAGQNGVIFAAALKLLMPFIIVFPGIMAWQLYGSELALEKKDHAYPLLLSRLVPVGLRGVLFAALFGAVMSSLDSVLNSASTIFTMDLYKRHAVPDASQHRLVTVGRIATAVFVVFGCLIAPLLDEFGGVFAFMQKAQGFISPGIVAAFLFGLLFRRAPAAAGTTALLLNPPLYGFLNWWFPQIAFLNHIAITFGIIVAVMAVITLVKPLAEPRILPHNTQLDLRPSRLAGICGAAVVLITIGLYAVFW